MFGEHLEALARVVQGNVLGRRDDHCAGDGHRLEHRQLGVAGARREVDDEVVECAPLDVLGELGDDLVDHRPAPDDRVVLAGQEGHAHQFHAVLFGRNERLVLGCTRRLVGVDHPRHVRAVHVRIEEADARAELGESCREVDRDGRLPDAPLARGDGDDVLDARQHLLVRHHVIAVGNARREVGVDTLLEEQLTNFPGDVGFGRRVGRTECEVDGNLEAVLAVLDADVVDESERDNIVAEFRIFDRPEAVANSGFVHTESSVAASKRVVFPLVCVVGLAHGVQEYTVRVRPSLLLGSDPRIDQSACKSREQLL